MKHKTRQNQQVTYNAKKLQEDLMHEAKVIGIPLAAAEVITTKIVAKVTERVAKRTVITVDDINRFIADEAEKYNSDLAYVYKNRGKII